MTTQEEDNNNHITILIVEDSSIQQELLRRILHKAGYSTLIAKNGDQGLALATEKRPSLIISDIAMPQMDGYQMCHHIRVNPQLKGVPIILLTQLSGTEDIIKGLDCGADNFIVKPYDEEQLLARIKYLLAQRDISERDTLVMGIDLYLGGKNHTITSDRRQILNLLISTYESAVHQNRILMSTQRELHEKTEQLEKMNALLENRVKEEIDKRMKHERLLVQQTKLAAMGEMVGAIAHQWRQPLSALSIIIQDMSDAAEFGEFTPQYIQKTIESSLKQISFMSKTIDDFRNFFKPSKEKALFDIHVAAREVLSIMAGQLKHYSIQTSSQCSCHKEYTTGMDGSQECKHGLLNVYGYPNEFIQVLLNIVSNAKDAIVERREKGLMSQNAKGHIDLSLRNEEGRISISIKDNGGGVAEEIMDRIFEPYFTTKEGRGTGIGLYMCKVIVEDNMQGKLFVRNVNDGAEFVIEIREG